MAGATPSDSIPTRKGRGKGRGGKGRGRGKAKGAGGVRWPQAHAAAMAANSGGGLHAGGPLPHFALLLHGRLGTLALTPTVSLATPAGAPQVCMYVCMHACMHACILS